MKLLRLIKTTALKSFCRTRFGHRHREGNEWSFQEILASYSEGKQTSRQRHSCIEPGRARREGELQQAWQRFLACWTMFIKRTKQCDGCIVGWPGLDKLDKVRANDMVLVAIYLPGWWFLKAFPKWVEMQMQKL